MKTTVPNAASQYAARQIIEAVGLSTKIDELVTDTYEKFFADPSIASKAASDPAFAQMLIAHHYPLVSEAMHTLVELVGESNHAISEIYEILPTNHISEYGKPSPPMYDPNAKSTAPETD